MKKNVGSFDRVVRVILAIVLGYLYFAGTLTGALGIVALIVGVVFLVTALAGSCPLYSLFGISTCPLKGKKA